MSAINYHPRLGLPIYGAGTPELPVLVTKDEIRTAGQLTVDSFVRYIWSGRQSTLGRLYQNIEGILSYADARFEHIATHTGAVVLTHSWGLISIEHHPSVRTIHRANTSEHVPPGYLLGAKVPVVRKTRDITPEEERPIKDGIADVCIDTHDGIKWFDNGAHQFMTGTTAGSTDEQRFLVDLDITFSQG